MKTIITAILLIIILHVLIVYSLSGVEVFSCPIWYSLGNKPAEWVTMMCDINYKYDSGLPATKLTTGAEAARIGLIYVLPILMSTGLIYLIHLRRKNVGKII